MSAEKDTRGKLRMDLIRPEMAVALASILEMGAQKYEPHGFMSMTVDEYKAALLRHLYRMDLEPIDEESNRPHSWHVLACAAIIVSLERPEPWFLLKEMTSKEITPSPLIDALDEHFRGSLEEAAQLGRAGLPLRHTLTGEIDRTPVQCPKCKRDWPYDCAQADCVHKHGICWACKSEEDSDVVP